MKLKRFDSFNEAKGWAPSWDGVNGGTSAIAVKLVALGDLSDYTLSGLHTERPEFEAKVGDNVVGVEYDTKTEVKGRVSKIIRNGEKLVVYINTEDGEEKRIEPFDMDILKSDPQDTPGQVQGGIPQPNDFYRPY